MADLLYMVAREVVADTPSLLTDMTKMTISMLIGDGEAIRTITSS